MYVGHFGLALASKRVAPETSLGTLFVAAEFIDFVWPVLLATGVEQVRIVPGITKLTPLDFSHYPISHSLAAVCVWALLAAVLYYAFRRYARGSVVVGALILSHWFLDALVHRPDLPISANGPARVGLGLWNYPLWAVSLEGIIFAAGIAVYLRATVPLDRVGTHALWPMLALMAGTWVMNFFGPPPPNVSSIIAVSFMMWIYIPWAAWMDRHRRSTTETHRFKLFTSRRAGI